MVTEELGILTGGLYASGPGLSVCETRSGISVKG